MIGFVMIFFYEDQFIFLFEALELLIKMDVFAELRRHASSKHPQKVKVLICVYIYMYIIYLTIKIIIASQDLFFFS